MLNYDVSKLSSVDFLDSETQINNYFSSGGLISSTSNVFPVSTFSQIIHTEQEISSNEPIVKYIQYSQSNECLTCPVCHAIFSGRSRNKELLLHLESVHSCMNVYFMCPICKYTHKSASGLSIHLRVCSKNKAILTYVTGNESIIVDSNSTTVSDSNTVLTSAPLSNYDSSNRINAAIESYERTHICDVAYPFPVNQTSKCPVCNILLSGRSCFQMLENNVQHMHPSIRLNYKCFKCGIFENRKAISVRAHAAKCKGSNKSEGNSVIQVHDFNNNVRLTINNSQNLHNTLEHIVDENEFRISDNPQFRMIDRSETPVHEVCSNVTFATVDSQITPYTLEHTVDENEVHTAAIPTCYQPISQHARVIETPPRCTLLANESNELSRSSGLSDVQHSD
ncbi:hypothetical protein GJ496_010038 [Pomphorhynchus laevis]|nr:hypothetical protein GJ496_010038 [Pomphorhynchus laevis]